MRPSALSIGDRVRVVRGRPVVLHTRGPRGKALQVPTVAGNALTGTVEQIWRKDRRALVHVDSTVTPDVRFTVATGDLVPHAAPPAVPPARRAGA